MSQAKKKIEPLHYAIKYNGHYSTGAFPRYTPLITITGSNLESLIPAESLLFKCGSNIKITINQNNHKFVLPQGEELPYAWVQCIIGAHNAAKNQLSAELHGCLQLAALIMKKIRQKHGLHACARLDTTLQDNEKDSIFFINTPRKNAKHFSMFLKVVHNLLRHDAHVSFLADRHVLVIEPVQNQPLRALVHIIITEMAQLATRYQQCNTSTGIQNQSDCMEEFSFCQELLDALTLRNEAFCM